VCGGGGRSNSNKEFHEVLTHNQKGRLNKIFPLADHRICYQLVQDMCCRWRLHVYFISSVTVVQYLSFFFFLSLFFQPVGLYVS
jgi:hypothetical protein